MRGRRIWVALLMGMAVLAGGLPVGAADRVVTVGVVTGGGSVVTSSALEELRQELRALSGPDLELVIPQGLVRSGGWSREGVESSLNELGSLEEAELILALGYVASGVSVKAAGQAKPVLASHLFQKPALLPQGVYGLEIGPVIQAGVTRFVEEFKPHQITLVVDAHAEAILPEIESFVGSLFHGQGVALTVQKAASEPQAILAATEGKGDCVILSPFPQLSVSEMRQVAEGLKERGVISYAMGGRGDVEAGLLFTAEGEGTSRRLVRRMALALYSMARGEALMTGADDGAQEATVVINLATARAVGFSPGWELARYAVKVEPLDVAATELTLPRAIARARAENPSFQAQRHQLAASGEDVSRALSYLAPRITSQVMGVRVDKNSAEKSMGRESEESLKACLTLSQVLYSEKAVAGYSAIKKLQKAREHELVTEERNLALKASQSYINVLKARSVARVHEGNLALTQENLSRARSRKRAGVLNPSELFRWESELAANRRALLAARAQVRFAENALKRVCGMPLSQRVIVMEVAPTSPSLLSSRPGFKRLMNDPGRFEEVIAALVEIGLEASPELSGLRHALASGRRRIKGARRTFYLPDVALQAKVTEVLDRHGFDEVLPPFDEREWQVGIQVSLPLVTGGERLAELRKVTKETAAIASRRRHVMSLLREQIMDAAIAVQVSEAAMGLADLSREAAEKNLSLVSDAYTEGAVAVITLLDAQNTTVKARIAAENAVYDHMLDLLKLQRLLGPVDLSGDEGDKRVKRLENALVKGGGKG